MIKAHEYLDLDKSIIGICTIIIEELIGQGDMKYNELYNRVLNRLDDDIRTIYIYALDFLFLLDKVNYYPESDVLELKK